MAKVRYEELEKLAAKYQAMWEEDENVFLHHSDDDFARALESAGLIGGQDVEKAGLAMYVWGCYQPGGDKRVPDAGWFYQYLLVGMLAAVEESWA